MKRFEILGISSPRGRAGFGWETAEEAQGFIDKYIMNPEERECWGIEIVGELKVHEFDFTPAEPKIEIKRLEEEEEVLMPLDDEDRNGETVLVRTGHTKVSYDLYIDGLYEGNFPSEAVARRFAERIDEE